MSWDGVVVIVVKVVGRLRWRGGVVDWLGCICCVLFGIELSKKGERNGLS